jgi:hypothetical protein
MTNNERAVKMQEQEDEAIVLTDEEIEEEREGSGYYKHVFKKPFEWEGKVYGSLTFDFESLTGRDTLAVERELAAKNIIPVVRSLNLPFQIRIAARACTETIGIDMLEALPIKDFERIMNRVRIFFISAE